MPSRSPLQNRVTPFGDLVAAEARGLLFGNRGGRFHDPGTQRLGRRRWASRQWIICVLDFKNRHRHVWGTGYTELFFLDEVTALAAGHRPCFECRRRAATAYAGALAAGCCMKSRSSAPEMDRILHTERLDGRSKRRHMARYPDLPDGAVVDIGGTALAVRGDRLLPWSVSGYEDPERRPKSGTCDLLTPPATVAALAAGYRPLWHPSALD
jgi:hypothetical protein